MGALLASTHDFDATCVEVVFHEEAIMAARKSTGARKFGAAAGKSVESAVGRMKKGTLKGGAGAHPKVTSRKQAIAIGLAEAREKGAKVPAKKSTAKKSTAKKSTAKKSDGQEVDGQEVDGEEVDSQEVDGEEVDS